MQGRPGCPPGGARSPTTASVALPAAPCWCAARGRTGCVQVGEAERRRRRGWHGGGAAAATAAATAAAAPAAEAGGRAGYLSGVRGLLGLHVYEAEGGTTVTK